MTVASADTFSWPYANNGFSLCGPLFLQEPRACMIRGIVVINSPVGNVDETFPGKNNRPTQQVWWLAHVVDTFFVRIHNNFKKYI